MIRYLVMCAAKPTDEFPVQTEGVAVQTFQDDPDAAEAARAQLQLSSPNSVISIRMKAHDADMHAPLPDLNNPADDPVINSRRSRPLNI